MAHFDEQNLEAFAGVAPLVPLALSHPDRYFARNQAFKKNANYGTELGQVQDARNQLLGIRDQIVATGNGRDLQNQITDILNQTSGVDEAAKARMRPLLLGAHSTRTQHQQQQLGPQLKQLILQRLQARAQQNNQPPPELDLNRVLGLQQKGLA